MNIDWQEKQAGHTVVYSTSYGGHEEKQAQQLVDKVMDKAIEILPLNIRDDSRYFLVQWCKDDGCLSIVVTDETKQCDSRWRVECRLSDVIDSDDPNQLRFWVRDYLTTSSAFIHFSLVAVFCTTDRQHTQLL
jgi:hypothetical protein